MRTNVTLPAVVLVTLVLLTACGNDAASPAKVSGETPVTSESQINSQDISKAGIEIAAANYSVAVYGLPDVCCRAD
ncbi:hypothetical protein [Paenibacillus sp. JGP012]|uniref:hypothetical protein n=1 Tax=Paenibacillus sp. JGP012 TaxID=2735914 RepID=UPI0016228E1B|nr:hypothetical protein [Paenibacillus sp. JGP012]